MKRTSVHTRMLKLAWVPLCALTFLSFGCSNSAGADASLEPKPPTFKSVTDKPAFPGAVGYGAVSVGGRGGRIIPVTTLADSGPGSFRACVMERGPRVCVFRVSGVIRFTDRPPIIREPYLTIAGQTAPGGGITLAHAGPPNGRTPLVLKGTHDVIVQHIRVRPDLFGENRESEDAITIENSSRVIIDHVSATWARDELINGYADNDDLTISNSIFALGIPPHDKCALLASDPTDRQNVSFIGNICAHNGDRNPDANFPVRSCVEVVNNVFYNGQSEFTEVWESEGGTPISIVGNTYIAGRNTHAETVGVQNDRTKSLGQATIYMWDNRFFGSFIHVGPNTREALTDVAPCPLTIRPLEVNAAYDSVLAKSGAWPRDDLDRQVVDDVKNRSGRIGGMTRVIPAIDPGEPYPDRDNDGMDDGWERTAGADPTMNDAWKDSDGNGTSNLEEFLAYREKQLAP